MGTAFDYQVRVLACSHCGAPLQAALAGAQVVCGYCQAANIVVARDERPVVELAPTPPIDEEERIRRLRAQEGDSGNMSPEVRGLISPEGLIQPWKMQEALAVWQSTRKELTGTANYATTELFLALTTVITQSLDDANDAGSLLRQRAMLETALDAVALPRQRQVLRAFLSRTACRIGDLEAAEHWIALCDPRSEDIQADSHFRVARAYLDTARGNFNEVLGVLGGRMGDVPLYPAIRVGVVRPLAAVLRANAWERLGDLPAAVGALREIEQLTRLPEIFPSGEARSMAPVLALVAGIIAKHSSLGLCAQAPSLLVAEDSNAATQAAAQEVSNAAARLNAAFPVEKAPRVNPIVARGAIALAGALALYALFCPHVTMLAIGGPYKAAVADLASCQAARDVLGDDVHLSWFGFPMGSSHHGDGGFSLPVAGSKDSADLDYNFRGDSFTWSLPVPGKSRLTGEECKATSER